MSLEIRLVRVAPFGGIQQNNTIAEFVVTPHNLFDVTNEIARIAHEVMLADTEKKGSAE